MTAIAAARAGSQHMQRLFIFTELLYPHPGIFISISLTVQEKSLFNYEKIAKVKNIGSSFLCSSRSVNPLRTRRDTKTSVREPSCPSWIPGRFPPVHPDWLI
jgi:hypothetical protein